MEQETALFYLGKNHTNTINVFGDSSSFLMKKNSDLAGSCDHHQHNHNANNVLNDKKFFFELFDYI